MISTDEEALQLLNASQRGSARKKRFLLNKASALKAHANSRPIDEQAFFTSFLAAYLHRHSKAEAQTQIVPCVAATFSIEPIRTGGIQGPDFQAPYKGSFIHVENDQILIPLHFRDLLEQITLCTVAIERIKFGCIRTYYLISEETRIDRVARFNFSAVASSFCLQKLEINKRERDDKVVIFPRSLVEASEMRRNR